MRGSHAASGCFMATTPVRSLWIGYGAPWALELRGLLESAQWTAIGGLVFIPAALERSIAAGEYDARIGELAAAGDLAAFIYERLLIESTRGAADFLATLGAPAETAGRVSAGVSPELCYDTEGLIEEAQNLAAAVARRNFMVQIPATSEGLEAARHLFTAGSSVHLTHVFSTARCRDVAAVHASALAARQRRGLSISGIECAATLESEIAADVAAAEAVARACSDIYRHVRLSRVAGEPIQPMAVLVTTPDTVLARCEAVQSAAAGIFAAVPASPLLPAGPQPVIESTADNARLDRLQGDALKQDLLLSDRIVELIDGRTRRRTGPVS